TVDVPAGTTYTVGQAVTASYSCSDGGSGVSACTGPVASGAALDTSAAGRKTFPGNAAGNAGNTTTETIAPTGEPPAPSAPRAPAPPPPPPAHFSRLTVFAPDGIPRCGVASGDSCTVELHAGSHLLASGHAAGRAGGIDLLVTLRLTAYGRHLLATHVGGVL